MTALIDVKNASVGAATATRNGSSIGVNNVVKQRVDVTPPPPQKVELPDTSSTAPGIEITHIWHVAKMKEFEIELDTKVPKALSILPQITDSEMASVPARSESKIYIQVGDTPAFATLEQIKLLNTKTVFVDELSDTKITTLSDEDIVMLRKE